MEFFLLKLRLIYLDSCVFSSMEPTLRRKIEPKMAEQHVGIETLHSTDLSSLHWTETIDDPNVQHVLDTIEDVYNPNWPGSLRLLEKHYARLQLTDHAGAEYDVLAKKEIVSYQKEEQRYYYDYILTNGDSQINSNIYIIPSKTKGLVASTSIVKNDTPEHRLPRGLGKQCYAALLHTMQQLAEKMGEPIHHEVSMDLEFGDGSMTAEKWRSIFLPLLNAEGRQYVEGHGGETFHYTFLPKDDHMS